MASQTWTKIFEVALVSTSLLTLSTSCGDEGDEGEQEANTDAGCPAADAGCPAAEPGCPSADAGCPAADPGCPATEGCSADAGCPAADAGCPAADPGCPAAVKLPQDPEDWKAWLDAKSYESWHCDPTPQNAISDSPHGKNVICVNDVLWAARCDKGPWPLGSASVKLTFDAQGAVKGRYIDARLREKAAADGWYFYNAGGPQGYGTDSATKFCADCHDNDGARDYLRRLPKL